MQHWRLTAVLGAISLVPMFYAPALADPRANLEGFEEVPIVSTTGEGRCNTRIREKAIGSTIEVELSYENLAGNVQQAHIHLAQRDVNGGIVLFLCSNLPSPPAGTPPCPGPHDGTVTRTLTSADVLPVTTQGIAAGEIDEVIDAIRQDKAYCNVHSDMSPDGEIRGQLD
jgi:hypothetical protein